MPLTTLHLDHLLGSTDPADHSARLKLSSVSLAIAKARKVVVVSGAGISCSSGIPDFRSEKGLYSLVKARYPDAFFTGRDLFSSGLFANPLTTSIFYTFIAELSLACQVAQPTRTHHFIARLESKGKLLRSYTQNVDGLERRLGLESGGRGKGLKKKGTRNVELHGDLGRVRCTLCFGDWEAKEEWVEMFREGEAPECPACSERCESRLARSARATPIGTLRPAIVLYDEPHPLGDDIGALQTYDLMRSPDVLLIMGTSLKVHGLKRLVKEFSKAVHARKGGIVVFVNATPPPGKEWEGVIDVHVQGETDRWVERVEHEWRHARPADWEVQTRLDGEMPVVSGKTSVTAKGKPRKAEKENRPPAIVHLPTPRPSASPSRSQATDHTEHDLPPSSPYAKAAAAAAVMSTAPPTPLSPSKRRANVNAPQPEGTHAASPAKKVKPTYVDVPSTGVPSTPGKGNLFASPRKVSSGEWEDEVGGAEGDEVFGTPKRDVVVKGRKLVAGKMRTTGKHDKEDKENMAPRSPKVAAGIRKGVRVRKPTAAVLALRRG